jgi:hypothetical protein
MMASFEQWDPNSQDAKELESLFENKKILVAATALQVFKARFHKYSKYGLNNFRVGFNEIKKAFKRKSKSKEKGRLIVVLVRICIIVIFLTNFFIMQRLSTLTVLVHLVWLVQVAVKYQHSLKVTWI